VSDALPFWPVKPIRGGKPFDGLYQKLASSSDWMCQAKINGKRGIWDGHKLWSRSGELVTIEKARDVYAELEGCPTVFDGELLTSGTPGLRTDDGKALFLVFDLPDHPGTLDERVRDLTEIFSTEFNTSRNVRMCPMNVSWAEVEAFNWEGVVFKRRNSLYIKGRKGPGQEVPAWIKYRKEWL